MLRTAMLPAGEIRLRTWVGGPSVEAPTIVFVHGVLASSRYMLPTARLLAREYRVYVPDLPGYGKSDKTLAPPTPQVLADSLAAFMYENEISHATLLGNSYGCQVAVQVAMRYSELVTRLILVGPTVDRRGRRVGCHAGRLALDAIRERPSLLLVLAGDIVDLGVPRAIKALRAMLADRPEAVLPKLGCPALVVRGEHDPIVPHDWAVEVAHLLPHGSLITIPGGGHAANYSNPQELTAIVVGFIEASPGSYGRC